MLRNWQAWVQIEPKIRSYCRVKFRDTADAADALAGGRELFVRNHRPARQGQGQIIRYAQLCCLRAGRDQRLGHWRRESIDQEGAAQIPASTPSAQDLLDSLPIGLDATCRSAIDLLLRGHTQRETAQELGLSVTGLRRRLLSLAGRA